ncbi:DUF4221 family protein [Marivirga sp.]|uniref:DUF4221 family protein n=1 Tax=Marivirga sp. TaxID=2018662 RepID=UPI002D7EE965|nr:DUF4221 family protein [Marivirga sp.]HET8859470.1 DUF4221 family protein [Marivirga sp.]
MKYSLFITILLLAFLISCDTEEKKNGTREHNHLISITDTVNFKIPFSSSNQPQYMQYKILEGKEFLAIGNKNNYTIEVFDFFDFEIIHKYNLPTSGPYDIKFPQMFGFFIKNWDSVYVGLYNRPNFLMIDKNSQVKDFTIIKKKISNPIFLSRAPMTEFEGNFITASSPIHPFDRDYWKNPLFTSISFKNKDYHQFFEPPLVDGYEIYGGFHNNHSYALNSEKGLVLSNLTFDPNLYIYNVRREEFVKSIHLPSKYFDKVPPFQKTYNELSKGSQEHYIQNPSYKSILYDKWRDVYYRFAEQGVELKDIEGNFNTWYDKKPSVLILNNEFEIIGETDLPQSIYRISDAFVGKDGLYIAANNDKNPNYNENELTFHVYELSTKAQ